MPTFLLVATAVAAALALVSLGGRFFQCAVVDPTGATLAAFAAAAQGR